MANNGGTRVLMLVENCSYPRDVRVRREAETLARSGLRVSVICPALRGQPRREALNKVQVYRYAPPPEASGQLGYLIEYGYSLAAALFLALRIAISEGVDVIHAANPPDLFVVIAALFKPFGVKFVYDQHDLAPEMYRARYANGYKPLIDSALRTCERWSYRLADHVIVANSSYYDNAKLRGNIPEDRISIVRNGPDADQLERCDGTAERDGAAKTTFAYLGLMGAQDGVAYLIRALKRLADDLGRSDFLCKLIGTGEEQSKLQALAAEYGLDAHVEFMGFIPDPDFIPHLLSADICVDPDPYSEYNDCSTMIKIMDYMSCGKAIVAFDLKETRRSAQGAALYVKPNDELEFAKALAYLMDHPEERKAMGEQGRRRVKGELSWAVSAERLMNVYASLARIETGRWKVTQTQS